MSEKTASKVYEVVKFVNPDAAIDALEGRAVRGMAPDGEVGGILRRHSSGDPDAFMVSFYDVITDKETVRMDIRNFTEIIVP